MKLTVRIDKSTWAQLLLPCEGARWAVYVNDALDSANLGSAVFLKVGETCTFKTPPERMPDTAYGPGWKYKHLGLLNVETCTVRQGEDVYDVDVVADEPPPPKSPPRKSSRKQQLTKSRS